jgi:hypothetical protein
MISHEQNNIRWPEEETPPPLAQKHTSTPASSWRGWSLWLRVLGIVVPLVAGFALFAFPIDERLFPFMHGIGVYLLMTLLVGVLSAGLLRSWWAILIVPVAFSVGFFLANVYQSGGFDFLLQSSPEGTSEGLGILVGLGIVPVALGATIGAPIGKKIEQRLQH